VVILAFFKKGVPLIYHPCYNIVQKINDVMQKGGLLQWLHTLRKANQVVDKLANFDMFLDVILILGFLIQFPLMFSMLLCHM